MSNIFCRLFGVAVVAVSATACMQEATVGRKNGAYRGDVSITALEAKGETYRGERVHLDTKFSITGFHPSYEGWEKYWHANASGQDSESGREGA
jgi:hypothetical protein